jgi:biopolymer transport protein TolR
MALATVGADGLSCGINVTPMIDILLVLLIIFMAITPVSPTGLEATVPQPSKGDGPQNPDRSVVLQIFRTDSDQPAYRIDGTDVQKSDLTRRLRSIFSTRATRVMFIQGDKGLNFGSIANGIDIAKGAGVDHVGLITPTIAAAQ